MFHQESTIQCDGCGVEITWGPFMVGEERYCCEDCFEQRPCRCGDRLELDDERRSMRDHSIDAGLSP